MPDVASVRSMSWICSGVSEATSAAMFGFSMFRFKFAGSGRTGTPPCGGAGVLPNETGAGGETADGGGCPKAETGGGGGNAPGGGASFPAFSTHMPTSTFVLRDLGNLRLSSSSMYSGIGSDDRRGTMYSSRPGCRS